MLSLPAMELYWSGSFLAANAFIGLNLLGALMLGMLVGYERSYNGRAAGMRTYGLVCMASTALTIFVGFAPFWYGGAASQVAPDATRVVQGVVTGVGFLCAGVIVKDGLNVSGLTTAASIWAASAIGVLLGVGLLCGGLAAVGALHAVHVGGPPDRAEAAGPFHLRRLPQLPAGRRAGARGAHPGRAGSRVPRDARQFQRHLQRQRPRMAVLRRFAGPLAVHVTRTDGPRPGALRRCSAVQHRSR